MLRKIAIKANSVARNWQNYLFLISSYSWSCMGHSSSAPMANADIIIEPKARHTATVIFLHGLGDTGHGWAEGFRSISAPHIKYVFPTANTIPVTLNMGMQMPSWFDLYSLNPDGKEDEEGILKASALLKSIVEAEEKKGINLDRICIGGFSQGGAVALHAGLTSGKKLGGIVALSSWMPLHKKVKAALGQTKTDMPIFQAHGNADPVVPYQFGKLTSQLVGAICPNHQFQTYENLGHSSHPREMADVAQFILKSLPAPSS